MPAIAAAAPSRPARPPRASGTAAPRRAAPDRSGGSPPPAPRPAAAPPARLPGGLRYVSPDALPGLTRELRGQHYRFRRPDGQWVTDEEEIARIRKLAIPPAYTQVWICPLPDGHLQATGLDARGRRQYRYHPEWRQQRDEAKFERMQAFGRALPRIRARVARDLKPRRGEPALSRAVVLATIVRLLDTTFLRVGNEEYAAANRSYGLTTLRNRHAGVRGSQLTLRFRGKSGVEQQATLDDPRVARVVRRCQQLPGQELFQYEDEDGTRHAVGSSDVNDYLREITRPTADSDSDGDGLHFTAKDFRTWHGTAQALELTRLACTGETGATAYNAKQILTDVAKQLGNTPAVCKKSYVHPAVLDLGARLASDAGPDMQRVWDRIGGGASPRGLSAAERRLLGFLREHQRASRRAVAGTGRRKTAKAAPRAAAPAR
ncbi:DNA topoisomerase IB [Acidovorax sp. NCPPB 4044]|uniref:DNA topoisomerase IB n=1 Tax=Acidovorax sp. NCPPB 4044 TaxID=2940490 RepID=UPI00230321D0|nr:DNA topoisomerase IB [Acidovorax sp. NCPPB 4044]MDA8520018.1 DNA topoisomerase IB [Acidovorax sp. NCPPB 4044]